MDKKLNDILQDSFNETIDVQHKFSRVAVKKLEKYVEGKIVEALGWMYAEACVSLDKGEDIRKQLVPDLLERAKKELSEC